MKAGNYIYGCVILLTVVSFVKGPAISKINCGTGAAVGSPYVLSCGITGTITNGINWFRGTENIITCVAGNCVSSDTSKYNVGIVNSTTRSIEILSVTNDDFNHEFSCLDSNALVNRPDSTCNLTLPVTTTPQAPEIEKTDCSTLCITLSVGGVIVVVCFGVGVCIVYVIIKKKEKKKKKEEEDLKMSTQ